MAARPDFQRVQEEFCAHLRDPRHNPRPEDVEERRMAVYRDLFFKNIQGFVERSFPMTARLLGPDALHELSYAFFSQHGCRTPYFHKIGQEFVDYLSREHVGEPDVPPFLAELAHHEWTDVRVRISAEAVPHDPDRIDPDGDLLEHPVVLSPGSELCIYAYPVHRIDPDHQPQQKPESPTFLFAFRDSAEKVRFMELNPVTARLIALLKDQPDIPARSQLDRIAAELGRDSPEAVVDGGRQVLERLRERGAILGVLGSPA